MDSHLINCAVFSFSGRTVSYIDTLFGYWLLVLLIITLINNTYVFIMRPNLQLHKMNLSAQILSKSSKLPYGNQQHCFSKNHQQIQLHLLVLVMVMMRQNSWWMNCWQLRHCPVLQEDFLQEGDWSLFLRKRTQTAPQQHQLPLCRKKHLPLNR